MSASRWWCASGFLIALVNLQPLFSYPTSLNLVPVPETLERGRVRVEVENDGYPGLFDREAESLLLTEFCVGPRAEVGVDLYDLGRGSRPYFNAKVELTGDERFAVTSSAGILDLEAGVCPSHYLVAGRSVKGTDLCAGYLRVEGEGSGFLGAGRELAPR